MCCYDREVPSTSAFNAINLQQNVNFCKQECRIDKFTSNSITNGRTQLISIRNTRKKYSSTSSKKFNITKLAYLYYLKTLFHMVCFLFVLAKSPFTVDAQWHFAEETPTLMSLANGQEAALRLQQQELLQQQQQLLQQQRDQQQLLQRASHHAPILKVKSLEGYLPDSAERGTLVRLSPTANAEHLQILVHDEDLKPGMPPAIYQYILTGFGAEKFAVNERGYLYVNAADVTDMDLSASTHTYRLHVLAREVDTQPTRSSEPITISVHVVASNAHAPIFAQSAYFANVSATVQKNVERTVLKLEAFDVDNGDFGRIVSYRIASVSDNAENFFRYDMPTKELRVLGPLISAHTYQIILEAKDSGGLTGRTTIFVYALPEVTNVLYSQLAQNGQLPYQQEQTTMRTDSEMIKPSATYQTYLAEMLANTVKNSGYSISPEVTAALHQAQEQFNQQQQQHQLYPQQQQHYSQQPQQQQQTHPSQLYPQQINYPAVEQQRVQQESLYQQQQQSNLQHAPQQLNQQQRVSMPQFPLKNIPQLKTTATHYELSSRTSNGDNSKDAKQLLSAASVSGATYNRRLPAAVNYELADRHETIALKLSEAVPLNSIVTVLGDTESRGRFYFRIVDGNEDGKFAINPEFGTISTAQSLDREETAFYTLKIETRSRNPDQLLYWTLLNITITDVNDNAPQYLESMPMVLNLRVEEQTREIPSNLPLAHIAVRDVDADENGRVTMRVLPPMDKLYTINGDAMLAINGAFSRAHLGENHLTIAATDSGEPPLETRAHIILNIQGATSALATAAAALPLSASDASSSSSGGASHASDTDENLLNNAIFSRATLPPSALKMPAHTESAPLFTMINPPMSTDLPNSRQEEISWGPEFNRFSGLATNPTVTPSNALVRTTTITTLTELNLLGGALKRDKFFAPVFTTPVITLAVEENEEDLDLCTLEAKFPEELPAKYRDRAATITYVIEAGDESIFALDSKSGKLKLTKALDAEKQQSYTLRVGTREAHNVAEFVRSDALAHSATITVQVVDVNDYIPNFEQDVYMFTVSASAEPGTLVGHVTAYDNDANEPNNKITYRLLNTDGVEGYFHIDAVSGAIKLAQKVDDFSEQKLKLKLVAIDGGEMPQNATADAIVEIRSEEHTKHRPTNTNTRGDSGGYGDSAKQKNVGVNAGDSSKINETNGADLSAGSGRSRGAKFATKIRNNNNDKKYQYGSSETTKISRVRFSAQNYNAELMEGLRPPRFVLRLPVVYRDSGEDSRFLLCAIAEGNVRGAFSVAPSEKRDACELKAQTQLDRELTAHYSLKITVALGDDVESALVSLTVLDANDNAPKFIFANEDALDYTVSLSSTTLTESDVLTVQAKDADAANNGALHYQLDASSADAQFFAIEEESGTIRTRKRFAADTAAAKTHYEFRVMACDSPLDRNRTLCARARVNVNLVGAEHRFATVFADANAQKIRQQQIEIGKILSQFTSSCTIIQLERLEEHRNDNVKKYDAENGTNANNEFSAKIQAIWYAMRDEMGDGARLCRKAEYHRKLFSASTRELLASRLEAKCRLNLDDLLEEPAISQDDSGSSEDYGNLRGIDERLAAFILPLFDWHTGYGLMMWALLGSALIVLVGCCTFCICWRCDEKRAHKNRNGAMSAARRAYMNGNIYPMPKYGVSHAQNNWNSVYLPSLTPLEGTPPSGGLGVANNILNSGMGYGSLEHDKFYETQMLELPVTDRDVTMLHNKRFESPSIWSKSFNGNSNKTFYNYGNTMMNPLNIGTNGHIPHVSTEANQRNGRFAPHPQYGTTTTTMSSCGNGSGIPTPGGMISGRGAAARAAQKSAPTNGHYNATTAAANRSDVVRMRSTGYSDSVTATQLSPLNVEEESCGSGGDFSPDDDSTHQPLTYSVQQHNRANHSSTQHNPKYVF